MLNFFERLFGTWVREISARTLRADGMAGLLGAVLVLPQGIAGFQPGLHPDGAGRHGDGRRYAVVDRHAAARHAGQFHFTGGFVRLYIWRSRAHWRLCLA